MWPINNWSSSTMQSTNYIKVWWPYDLKKSFNYWSNFHRIMATGSSSCTHVNKYLSNELKDNNISRSIKWKNVQIIHIPLSLIKYSAKWFSGPIMIQQREPPIDLCWWWRPMLSGLSKWEVPVPRYGLLSFGLKVVANQSFEGLFLCNGFVLQ